MEVIMGNDATPEFLCEVYMTCSPTPLLKKSQHDRRPSIKEPLIVTLLELYKKERNYGRSGSKTFGQLGKGAQKCSPCWDVLSNYLVYLYCWVSWVVCQDPLS
jgi:hypothetical protein